jgi:hypothetical protein
MTKGPLIDRAEVAKRANTMRAAIVNLVLLPLLALDGEPGWADSGPTALPLSRGNLIHACEGPGGMLRAVASRGDCRARETPLSWEQRGGLRVAASSSVSVSNACKCRFPEPRERDNEGYALFFKKSATPFPPSRVFTFVANIVSC